MAQQANLADTHSKQSTQDGAPVPDRFAPRGVPVITGVNRVGLWSLYIKEVRRFLKVQTQTIWAPAITTLLFLVIFTVALGRSGHGVYGYPFGDFVAPGLIVMGMMQNSFANSSFSLLAGKIQGTIIDLLMPPLSEGELMTGIVAAAVTRALMVGCTVAAAMWLYPSVHLHALEPWAIVWFGLMGAILLALMGLLASIWAEKFDHNAAVTNFVIAPLSLLSGTFYTIDHLHGVFQTISRFNPFFYIISGFRYGFLGQSDIGSAQAIVWAAVGLGLFNAAFGLLVYRVLRSGWNLKS
ncbi:MAG: ABC transporter permease [Sphingomonadaceae bacterium]